MNLSEVCIRRPVFSTVICLVLIIVGILGYNNLYLRFLPDYEPNVIKITTNYQAGSAQYVQDNITTPIEDQISGVSGVDTVQSLSIQGASMITIELSSTADFNQVANDIRMRLELAKQHLPTDLVTSPLVQSGAKDMPLMRVAFLDKNLSIQAIRDFIDRNVTDQLTQISGVSSVTINGAAPYAMLIKLDPLKMTAVNIGVGQVQKAITESTQERSAGKIRGQVLDFPVNQKTKLSTVKEYQQIAVTEKNGVLVYLGDIAKVTLTGYDPSPAIVRVNGQPAVTIQVLSTTDGNEIETAGKIKALLKTLKSQAPGEMEIIPYSDMSIYMQASINEVYMSIYFAILCVVLVVYLFLGSFRMALVPVLTIPVCLIATFGVMNWLGFSINMITLVAIILSVGLVVDDAIVVMENIYRHVQQGTSSVLASIVGSKEITYAIIVMTMTLASVYAPFGFVGGMAAAFLKPFAFTLAGAVIISGFVSLTLSPMMCSRLLRSDRKESRFARFMDRSMGRLSHGYKRILTGILKLRFIVISLTIVIAVAGFYVAKTIPFESTPPEDIGLIFVGYQMTKNEDVRHVDLQLHKLQQIVKQYPQVATYVSLALSANVFGMPSVIIAVLKPLSERKLSSAQLAGQIGKKIKELSGVNAFVRNRTGGGGGISGIEFTLYGSSDYSVLHQSVEKIIKKLSDYPGLTSLRSNVNFDTQEYNVTVNRDVAAKMQVSVADINNVVGAMIGGQKVTDFTLGGRNYYSYIISPDNLRENINALSQFNVANAAGNLIPLDNLVNVEQVVSQSVLPHYNRQNAATITGQLGTGYSLGVVVKYLQDTLPAIMPQGVHYAFLGQAQDIVDSGSDIGLLFLLALVFIYLVMAAQFESFLDPLVILFSVPLCVVSAIVALKLFGGSLNLYTNIALITLVGLIAKHGILITHFANQLCEQGKETTQALVEAASIRLRPILMTTATMVMGALPLLLATGAGANSRYQIGLVIIVGMMFGTFFSLIVVPVAYSIAHQIRAKCLSSGK